MPQISKMRINAISNNQPVNVIFSHWTPRIGVSASVSRAIARNTNKRK